LGSFALANNGPSQGPPRLVAAHGEEKRTDVPHGTAATALPGHHEDVLENVFELILETRLPQLGADDADRGIAEAGQLALLGEFGQRLNHPLTGAELMAGFMRHLRVRAASSLLDSFAF